MRIERFEDIEAARELTRKVYELTKKPEFARDFDLKGQIQNGYDHAGRTFTLLGDSERARCHSRFHPAIRLAGWLWSKVSEKKVTLNPDCHPSGRGEP